MENEVILTTYQLIITIVGFWVGGLLVGIGLGNPIGYDKRRKEEQKNSTGD